MTVMRLRSTSLHRYPLYKYRGQFRFLFVVVLIAIYILALLPQAQAPQFHWSDKANHIFAFVVLGSLLRLGFRFSYWQSLLLLIGYGVFIEISQYFTPDRSAELADIGADTIGSFVGLKLHRYLGRFF